MLGLHTALAFHSWDGGEFSVAPSLLLVLVTSLALGAFQPAVGLM